jgi:chromosome segregation ATPase
MENPRIKKVEAEIDKTKAKIAEFTAKLRELEKEKVRLENDDIVAAIRKAGLEKHLDRLNEFISDANLPEVLNPNPKPVKPAVESANTENKEVTHDATYPN